MQIINVKMDQMVASKIRPGEKVDAYHLTVEDVSGKANICSFEENAKRLKLLLHKKQVREALMLVFG